MSLTQPHKYTRKEINLFLVLTLKNHQSDFYHFSKVNQLWIAKLGLIISSLSKSLHLKGL